MERIPKKELGKETSYGGYHITCKETGEEYDGVATTAWFHDNGSKAFRSVNGNITFIEPEKIESVSSGIKKVDGNMIHKYAASIAEEQELFNIAWNIAINRYPEINPTRDTFGQIVNSITTRLLGIQSQTKTI